MGTTSVVDDVDDVLDVEDVDEVLDVDDVEDVDDVDEVLDVEDVEEVLLVLLGTVVVVVGTVVVVVGGDPLTVPTPKMVPVSCERVGLVEELRVAVKHGGGPAE